MKVRLAGIEYDSVVDGPGVRTTVFFQGCPHNCPGCHNPESHNPRGGYDYDVDCLAMKLKEIGNPVTISGGEPFYQLAGLCELLTKLDRTDCWIYSGYKYETLDSFLDSLNMKQHIECLVDGKYEEENKSMNCLYRGSTNQRLVDPRKSTFCNVVEWQPNKVVEPII